MSLGIALPERIARLDEIASNLWWTCRPQARDLFRALDYPLWRTSRHNPVKLLRDINYERLQGAAKDPAFLSLYDSIVQKFDNYVSAQNKWFSTAHPELLSETIVYFSAEFAIQNSLPIYAGGLGVLAGDICKEGCNLGLPLIGVGFMYPQGYFQQRITADGWQEEVYKQLDFNEAPVSPITSHGQKSLVQVQLGNRQLHIGAWLVRLGKVNLYLLDTNVEENSAQDRQLSNRLYTADMEQRIQQEIVLGIGGVRVLRELGIKPTVWHANEGHTSFMMLERIREEVSQGALFTEAVQRVRATTVFTTHTPVPAGHDVFDIGLVDKYFYNYWGLLGIDRGTFLGFGHQGEDGRFNMAALALKMAGHNNAVSQLHGKVARKTWHVLWPELKEDEVPITHITNGVHVPTWIASEFMQLYEKYMGGEPLERCDDPRIKDVIQKIPDDELWAVHCALRRKLVTAMMERTRERWSTGEINAQQGLAMGSLLDPEVLTIAYVRRFTEYKRPALILYDMERLKRMVRSKMRPVQIVFAGKSHPADFLSKYLLHRVYTLATDRDFQGRIAFVEDYDMHMAHYLVQGADIWLNNPRRLEEACGTSGMKAGLNGVLNLSVRDGWWNEGYNGSNGWAIGEVRKIPDPDAEDRADAESLYHILENEVIPLFYDRDRNGVSHGWVRMMKESISSIEPNFCSRRMLKEYTERMYVPAIKSLKEAPVKPERQN